MNRILFLGMKPKRSVTRQIEAELEKWIAQEQCALMPGSAEYEVKVEKEEAFPYYHCFVEIGFGPHRFKSIEVAKTLQGALSNALRRMRVVSSSNRMPSVQSVA